MIPCLPLRRLTVLAVGVALLVLGLAAGAWAADDPSADDGPVVDILPIEGTLDPPVQAAIVDLLEDAEQRGSDLVVLQLDSRGGLAVDSTLLVGAVRGAQVPVVVYVGPGLAQAEARGLAGVLLLAADVGAMAPDAVLGPLIPVDLAHDLPQRDGSLIGEVVSDLAPPDDAAGVPADAIVVEAVDADTALELGIIDLQAGGIDGLLTDLDGLVVDGAPLALAAQDTTVNLHSLGLVRRTLHASATPIFIYLMLVVGLGLLLFELFQPGFGVAGIAAIIVLAFAAYGLAVIPVAWWAVLLIAAGLALLAADVAIAGLGIPTAAGVAALSAGSAFLYPSPFLGVPGWLIATTVVTAVVFFVVVMTIVLRAQAGPQDVGADQLVGQLGIVRSALNPEGHVFVDGALWRARWTDELDGKVPVGTSVRVHGVDGTVVLVEAADAHVGAGSAPEA